MDPQAIGQLISTYGFPIVMCGALFYYMTQQLKAHKEETDSMKESVNELRIAILQLTQMITNMTND